MLTNLIIITTSVVFWEGTTKAKAKAKTKQVCFAIIMILSQQQTSPISTKSFCFFIKLFTQFFCHGIIFMFSWMRIIKKFSFALFCNPIKRSSISGERFFHTFSYLLILFSNKFVLRMLNVNEIDPVFAQVSFHNVFNRYWNNKVCLTSIIFGKWSTYLFLQLSYLKSLTYLK